MKSALLAALLSFPLIAIPSAYAASAAVPAQANAPTTLEFAFDYELARLVSQSVAQGQFSDAAIAAIRARPASAAMVRKMKLKSMNLARMSEASTQELAELVAHELFHGVQAQVMPPPPRSKADTPVSNLGPVWTRRLLYDLLQEGSAELFTHPLADRPANAYSTRGKARIERNTKRMEGIVTMVETIGLRPLANPPRDEDGYEAIYGLLFYGDFDEPAYDLGWIMASAIERHDGKAAVYALLKAEPKQFLLRYQELAQQDPKLPKFSEDFVRAVRTL